MDDIELFPYQIEGAEWLSKKKYALLGDEMGLGKSAQAIRAADSIGAERILVLCPAVARINWMREFDKFSTVSRLLMAITSQRLPTLEKKSPSCVVSSYDLALTNVNSLKRDWDLLILDESHYLKSLEAKRTKAILGKDGIVRSAKRVWALSGTPAPNNPSELWPLLYTFGATKLNFETFVQRFCTYYDHSYGRAITGARNIPELKEVLKPIMLRRTKMEVMPQLPKIYFREWLVEPCEVDLDSESSFVQYVFPQDKRKELEIKLNRERDLVTNAFISLDDNPKMSDKDSDFPEERVKILEALANSVSTLRRYNGLQKIDGVVEVLRDELENNSYEKVVIFAIHRDVITSLRKKLHKYGPVTLFGGTPVEKRQRHIDSFQKNPKCRVFIGNIQAAGTAITLTSAHNVVFVEQDWVPGNNAQAMMRVHRIGQTKPVHIRFVAIADSIDQKIAQVLKRKTRELTEIFD